MEINRIYIQTMDGEHFDVARPAKIERTLADLAAYNTYGVPRFIRISQGMSIRAETISLYRIYHKEEQPYDK